MFVTVGAILGIAGAGSLVLIAFGYLCGALKEYKGIEFWVSVIGAVVRNGLMVAAGYAAFSQPMAAASLAWGAFAAYVVPSISLQWVKRGRFHVSDLIGTFYVTASFIALCAAILTVLQSPNA